MRPLSPKGIGIACSYTRGGNKPYSILFLIPHRGLCFYLPPSEVSLPPLSNNPVGVITTYPYNPSGVIGISPKGVSKVREQRWNYKLCLLLSAPLGGNKVNADLLRYSPTNPLPPYLPPLVFTYKLCL